MRRTGLLVLVLFTSLLFTLSASTFTISGYDVKLDVALDRVYHLSESLTLDYNTPSHGFFRSIPERYDNAEARVSGYACSAPFAIEQSGDYVIMKIGSADRLVSGRVPYTLSFDYDLGDDGYDDYDEVYYNIIGDRWDTSIDHITFTITFPKPVSSSRIWLNSGAYGHIGTTADYSLSPDSLTLTGSLAHLDPGQALTLRVEMDNGYFEGAYVKPDHTALVGWIFFLVAALIVAIVLFLYLRYGKDEPLTVVVRFAPPEGLNPLECGYVIDHGVDEKDCSAMLFYWADGGYLTIEEPKKGDFIFHKVKELPEGRPEAEVQLFASLFAMGDEATMKSLGKGGFACVVDAKVRPMVKNSFIKAHSLTDHAADSKKAISLVFGFLFVLFFAFASTVYEDSLILFALIPSLAVFFLSNLLSSSYRRKKYLGRKGLIGTFIMQTLLLVFGFFILSFIAWMGLTSLAFAIGETLVFLFVTLVTTYGYGAIEKRSDYGQKVIEECLGFREFIEKVEIDKLKMLIDQDPDVFYHVLSYAIVFGLEERWAQKFRNIYIKPATWYSSSVWSPMDYFFYSALFRRYRSSYQHVVVPASYPHTSTSGHGGSHTSMGSSGFSGGGYGGGGGGSW